MGAEASRGPAAGSPRAREERVVVLLVVVNSCRASYRFDHASMLIVARRPLSVREDEKRGKKRNQLSEVEKETTDRSVT